MNPIKSDTNLSGGTILNTKVKPSPHFGDLYLPKNYQRVILGK